MLNKLIWVFKPKDKGKHRPYFCRIFRVRFAGFPPSKVMHSTVSIYGPIYVLIYIERSNYTHNSKILIYKVDIFVFVNRAF